MCWCCLQICNCYISVIVFTVFFVNWRSRQFPKPEDGRFLYTLTFFVVFSCFTQFKNMFIKDFIVFFKYCSKQNSEQLTFKEINNRLSSSTATLTRLSYPGPYCCCLNVPHPNHNNQQLRHHQSCGQLIDQFSIIITLCIV